MKHQCSSRISVVFLMVFLAVYLLTQASPAFAQDGGTSLSLADYRARVSAAIRALASRDTSATQQLPSLQAEFAAIERVRYPSQEVVSVQPLLGLPDSTTNSASASSLGLSNARTRLHTTEQQLNGAVNDHTEERLLLLADVFARPEFNASESIWNRLQRWLRDLLRTLLPEQFADAGNLPDLTPVTQLISWIVAILGLILLAGLLSYWLQGLLRNFVTDAETQRPNAGQEMVLTSATARQQAEAAASAGNYRHAVRRLYLSALLLLEERGIVAHDRSLTNHEVLETVNRDHPVHAHLQPVVEAFDEVWYGVHEPDLRTFAAYEHEVDRLVETAAGESPASERNG